MGKIIHQLSTFVRTWTWCKSFIRLIRWSKCKRWWKCKRKQWWNYSRRKIFNKRIIYLSGWRSFAVLSWIRARIYTERFQGSRGGGFQVDSSANLNSPVIVVDAKVSGGNTSEIWRKEGKRLRKHRSRRWVIAKHAQTLLYPLMIVSDILYWLLFSRSAFIEWTNRWIHFLSLSLFISLFLARKGWKDRDEWRDRFEWRFPSAERNKRANNWTERRHGARFQWRIEIPTSSDGLWNRLGISSSSRCEEFGATAKARA